MSWISDFVMSLHTAAPWTFRNTWRVLPDELHERLWHLRIDVEGPVDPRQLTSARQLLESAARNVEYRAFNVRASRGVFTADLWHVPS